LSYFRPQQAGNMGLRITSMVLISTSTLSKKPGRVKRVFVPLTRCLTFGVHSKFFLSLLAVLVRWKRRI
jgi:hypothetical protein